MSARTGRRGSHSGMVATARGSRRTACRGIPSAATTSNSPSKFATESAVAAMPTGRCSCSYVSSRAALARPKTTQASFQARLWTSTTPVLSPSPPVGGNRCAARGQENSAYAKAVGDLGVHGPRLDRLDLNVDVGVTDGVEDVPAADCGREVVQRLEWREIGDLKYEVLWWSVHDDGAEPRGGVGPDHRATAMVA